MGGCPSFARIFSDQLPGIAFQQKLVMAHYLLIGAGFTRNWGGPLSEEITGSLLGELHDDPELVAALRKGPFEEAFQGFIPPTSTGPIAERLVRFQKAVTGLFSRLNKSLVTKNFEFNNELEFSVRRFLARFDAIFSLNQDLLLEIHYMQTFISQGKWSGVTIPGMAPVPPPSDSETTDLTSWRWRPTQGSDSSRGSQPLYKLHGSSNWQTEAGQPLLIMGNTKAGAIEKFPVLRTYQDRLTAALNCGDTKLMVIGYSFQDDHINSVIERASREHGLGAYLVDPRGRDVLIDPKMTRAAIRPRRDIEDIKLIGELRRPLSEVFAGDAFAYGELMRFFDEG